MVVLSARALFTLLLAGWLENRQGTDEGGKGETA